MNTAPERESMCAYLVVHTTPAILEKPRPCSRLATRGLYCGQHAMVAARVPGVLVRDGGFCSWCTAPARSYVRDGVTIALCRPCGRALARAVREGR